MIEDIKNRYKQILSKENIESCIEKLEEVLNHNTGIMNDLFLVLGRFSSLKRKVNQKVISFDQEEIERNKIRISLLDIIDNIKEDDLNDFASLKAEILDINEGIDDYPFYSFEGLQVGNFIEIMQEAINLIQNATYLKVIGSARQDLMAITDVPLMEKYLAAIETKLLDEKPGSPFYYRRITTQNLKSKFLDHIVNCFEISEKTGNQAEVVLEQDIDLTVTYFIIDDKMLVFNLYTTIDIGLKDNTMLLKSTDVEVINQFSKHFQEAWDAARYKELVIDNLEQFNLVIPVKKSIYKKMEKIRSCLRSIPNNSIRMDHAHREIEQTCSRIIGLMKYSLNIEHKLANGKLLSVFYRYINELTDGGSYEVLSFYEFWKNLSDLDTFIISHENALVRGAKILRIYVIDNNKIKNKSYYEKHTDIIKKNLLLQKKYNNYEFKILFSNNYKELLDLYENFGIWEQGSEKIVFFPEHDTPEYPIGKTSLYFINDDHPDHNDYGRNKARYERARNILEMRYHEQQKSQETLKPDQKKFLFRFGIFD